MENNAAALITALANFSWSVMKDDAAALITALADARGVNLHKS